ncbi:sterigmatocystin biosynthesis dehydrogenase stcV [Hyaloscypha finlandica]|nr:sterigmatocystin biosynthesis dehydrogenase stcV [Hyaloscypha finlandica]
MAFPAAAPPKTLLDRHRQLAPAASIRVSPLCLGAMNFGEAHKYRMGECTKETAFEILDYFHTSGGNFIDTANSYQDGESEMWLGEWMTARGNRDELVLATKYASPYMLAEKGKIQSNYGGNGIKSLRLSVEASLKKLQTSYFDLLYVHWWDYTTTIPELIHSLNDLIVAGKVLLLGISDTPAWVVTKANQYIYQGLWNPATRDFERDIIPMCRDEGMGLLPYGTLGQGRFQTEASFQEREKNNPGRKMKPATAVEKNKTPYVFPIVGGSKLEHIKGNIAALSVSLNDEDIKEIEGVYEFDPGFPHTFLSGSLISGGTPRAAEGPGDVWLTNLLGNFDWVEAEKAIKPAKA